MLRAVIGTMIAAEDTSGSTTFLDLTYPYKDPATGTQRRAFLLRCGWAKSDRHRKAESEGERDGGRAQCERG